MNNIDWKAFETNMHVSYAYKYEIGIFANRFGKIC